MLRCLFQFPIFFPVNPMKIMKFLEKSGLRLGQCWILRHGDGVWLGQGAEGWPIFFWGWAGVGIMMIKPWIWGDFFFSDKRKCLMFLIHVWGIILNIDSCLMWGFTVTCFFLWLVLGESCGIVEDDGMDWTDDWIDGVGLGWTTYKLRRVFFLNAFSMHSVSRQPNGRTFLVSCESPFKSFRIQSRSEGVGTQWDVTLGPSAAWGLGPSKAKSHCRDDCLALLPKECGGWGWHCQFWSIGSL